MVDQSHIEETRQNYLEDIQQVLAEDEQIWVTHSQNSQSSQINPTTNGGRRSVMIQGRTSRTLLVDKGKPLSGDKGMRTDKHGPRIRQGRMARV